MVSVIKRTIKDGSTRFRIEIRKKGFEASATFSDPETAELWKLYKEDLSNEIKQFSPPICALITIGDAIDLKCKETNATKRHTQEYFLLKQIFEPILHQPISYFNYETCQFEYERLLQIPTRKGGSSKSNTGRIILPSPITVFRKFALLNACINTLIDMKLSIVNNIQPFITHLRKEINK